MTTCRAARKKQFDDLLLLQNKTPLKQQQSGTLGQGNRQAKTLREREEGGGVGPTLLCCMSDLECSSLSLFLSLFFSYRYYSVNLEKNQMLIYIRWSIYSKPIALGNLLCLITSRFTT
jgi:hypothetical protein